MLSRQTLLTIAQQHYANGILLWTHGNGKPGNFHGACYIAGYTVEAMLKAAILKVTGQPDYDKTVRDPLTNRTERAHVHDPYLLFLHLIENTGAGDFTHTLTTWYPNNYRSAFPHHPGSLVFEWNARKRYQPKWRASRKSARKFLNAVYDLYITLSKEM